MNKDETITIALDVMGADVGPGAIIEGGLRAVQQIGSSLKLVLVGKSEVIRDSIKGKSTLPENVSIKDAPHAVAMSDNATEGVRNKKSSISIGLHMQKNSEADAFVSAGNTGAVMASSLLILGRIEGIIRPGIASFFPTVKENPTLVMDVGANVDCKPIHLYQFGIMGSVYTSLMYGNTSPRIGLLSIGEERSKGNELIYQTRQLFDKSNLNFVGHIEGRDILKGEADVVVTDGFVGNVLLKFAESVEEFLTSKIRRQINTNVFSRLGAILMAPFLRRLRRSFDYAESGGVPLLGINGVSIICHGSSSPKAIKNAVIVAVEMVRRQISKNIKEELLINNGKYNGEDDKQQNNGDRVVRSTSSTD
jgi:glycerol-3-phosphate acyltransferase PlsX